MDHRVERLRSPAECEIFAKNVTALKRPDLALQANRRAVQLLVATHEGASAFEADAFAAVYAYEALLSLQKGAKKRATATWQAIKRLGIVEAIQREVKRPREAASREGLRTLGLEDLAFEALVARHAAVFSDEAVQISKERLAETT